MKKQNKDRTILLNRSGRDIIFEATGENEITVSGDFGRYYRVASDAETGKIKFFDPEGGPFISTGCTIDHLTHIGDRRLVQEISFDLKEGKVILTFD